MMLWNHNAQIWQSHRTLQDQQDIRDTEEAIIFLDYHSLNPRSTCSLIFDLHGNKTFKTLTMMMWFWKHIAKIWQCFRKTLQDLQVKEITFVLSTFLPLEVLVPQIYKGNSTTGTIFIPAWGSNWGLQVFPVIKITVARQVRMSPASTAIWAWRYA